MKTLDLKTLATVMGGAKDKQPPVKCGGLINNCGNSTSTTKIDNSTKTQNGGVNTDTTVKASPKITLPFPGAPE